ncbi:MAG: type II toxin-antitoxin system YafQ family toxin [Muribaculaceae bacterium]|nr:type II toxin-antitoxin system YafQ family toxin [Muribaculaceae bacterium]
MTFNIIYSNKFKKSLKKCFKRGLDVEKLREVLKMLERGETLPPEYKAHKLSGKFKGNWECHILSYWLLVWYQNDKDLILLLIDTGTHSDLFG